MEVLLTCARLTKTLAVRDLAYADPLLQVDLADRVAVAQRREADVERIRARATMPDDWRALPALKKFSRLICVAGALDQITAKYENYV